MKRFELPEALKQKILPAVTFDAIKSALPVAEAILKGGLRVMEIPLRTDVALKAIALIRKSFPEMNVGAGTILNTVQLKKAVDAGAQFGLSPGFNQTIVNETKLIGFPFIPGVMTPSEIELACEQGFAIQKLFPAEQLGGVAFLKAMQGPYNQLKVKFIPMGGVSIDNIGEYTKLKNVIAVGGSWIASKELIKDKNYKAIKNNVIAALDSIK